ncbi:MAG: TIGR01212 family radical SAM protein [Deltaproteobacteria bacterium]
MLNPLPPLNPDLRYHNYASYLRRRLGNPAARIAVYGGFTCPNRDGTIGTGGCLYCNNDAFTAGIHFPGLPIDEQVRRTIQSPGRHRSFRRFLVYFQPFSNTFAPPEELERKYRLAFCHPDVAGIAVGTRPDCLGPEVLDVLSRIARDHYVSVEIGLQSISDDVLARVNRGHTVRDFEDAVAALRERKIDVGAHLIYALPGDTRENFMSAAGYLSRLGVQAVKLHHFHVVRGSGFEAAWRRGDVAAPAYDDYLAACVAFLERLAPEVSVMRLIASAPPHLLLDPMWEKGGRDMARDVAAALLERDSCQGALWNGRRRRGADG